ncbi:MAG: hypothetical protein WCK60_02495 [Candidatus Nomurabacteria bacterium]
MTPREAVVMMHAVKFICVEINGQSYVSCTPGQHADAVGWAIQAYPEAKLIGGGYLGTTEPRWDSETCRKEFGYDRPADATVAEEILRQVTEIFYPK